MKRIISGKPIPDWVREYDDTLLKDDARAMNYEIDDKDKGLISSIDDYIFKILKPFGQEMFIALPANQDIDSVGVVSSTWWNK